MPKYFEEYGRREPQSLSHVPITYAYGEPELSYYEMIEKDPPRHKRFHRAMQSLEQKMPIGGIYDFKGLVASSKAQPERLAFIDVGGGRGQAIKTIHKDYPELELGRCMLQDKPEVIESVEATEDPELKHVQKMPIDFHVSQPVKGGCFSPLLHELDHSNPISLRTALDIN
jgi:hypothetical protein